MVGECAGSCHNALHSNQGRSFGILAVIACATRALPVMPSIDPGDVDDQSRAVQGGGGLDDVTPQRFSETIEAYGSITRELRGDALVAGFDRVSDAVCAGIAF